MKVLSIWRKQHGSLMLAILLASTMGTISSCGSGGDMQVEFRSLDNVLNVATITGRESSAFCKPYCVEAVIVITDAVAFETVMEGYPFSRPVVTASYLPNTPGFFSEFQVVFLRIPTPLEYRVSVTKVTVENEVMTVHTEICDRIRLYGMAGDIGVWIVVPKSTMPVTAAPPTLKSGPPDPSNPDGPGRCIV